MTEISRGPNEKEKLTKGLMNKMKKKIKDFFQEYNSFVSADNRNRKDLFDLLKAELFIVLNPEEKQELAKYYVPISKLKDLQRALNDMFGDSTPSSATSGNSAHSLENVNNVYFSNSPDFTLPYPNHTNIITFPGQMNQSLSYVCDQYNTVIHDHPICHERFECMQARSTECNLNSEGEEQENEDDDDDCGGDNDSLATPTLGLDNNQFEDQSLLTESLDDICKQHKKLTSLVLEAKEIQDKINEINNDGENDEDFTKSVLNFHDDYNIPLIFNMAKNLDKYQSTIMNLHKENKIDMFIKTKSEISIFTYLLQKSGPKTLKTFLMILRDLNLKDSTMTFCKDDTNFKLALDTIKKDCRQNSNLGDIKAIQLFCFDVEK